MITVNISNSQLFLNVVGNDINSIDELPTILQLVKVGPVLNPKTGRRHVSYRLEEYPVDVVSVENLNSDIEVLTTQLAAEKKKNTKLQSEIRTLKNAIKIDSSDALEAKDDN
jgi:hypothetical protein